MPLSLSTSPSTPGVEFGIQRLCLESEGGKRLGDSPQAASPAIMHCYQGSSLSSLILERGKAETLVMRTGVHVVVHRSCVLLSGLLISGAHIPGTGQCLMVEGQA